MRLGLHINSVRHKDRAIAYIRTVRPEVTKLLADGWDDDIIAAAKSVGSKVVARRVEEIDDLQGNIARTLAWGRDRGWRMDYLEWANEEMQGKDNVDEWNRLCRYALKFCKELDALRVGTRGCVLNTSCGQPEEGYWETADALALARYCADHGHAIGTHEYYRPVAKQGIPWRLLTRSPESWGDVDGAWVLRIMAAVRVWRKHNIKCTFIVTESGRDAMSGTPGDGAGYRDDPTINFALQNLFIGRHYSAIPECVGWVGFGWGGSPRWASFDMAEDIVTTNLVANAMLTLPRGLAATLRFDKIAWAVEETARILHREGYRAEHDFIVNTYVKDAIKRRDG